MTIDEEAKSLLLGDANLGTLHRLPYNRLNDGIVVPNAKFYLVTRVYRDDSTKLDFSTAFVVDTSSLLPSDVIMGYYL